MMHAYGGHIAEVPLPHRYMFDDRRRRRPVLVSITRYGGNPHYYVSMTQDGNPVWDSSINGWRECWDDPRVKGVSYSEKFPDRVLAERWISRMMARKFPRHRRETKYLGAATAYHYKEGD